MKNTDERRGDRQVTDNVKLLPCPFCGGEAFYDEEQEWVECEECDITSPKFGPEAIATWNRRVPASGAAQGELQANQTELWVEMLRRFCETGYVRTEDVAILKACADYVAAATQASVSAPPLPAQPEKKHD